MLYIRRAALDDAAVAHHALRVDDHDGPPAVAFIIAPEAVGLRHFALGMEVGQERVIKPAQLLGESLVAINAIDADAQDLGIELPEALQVRLEGAELSPSGAGEIEHVKGQHHGLSTQLG